MNPINRELSLSYENVDQRNQRFSPGDWESKPKKSKKKKLMGERSNKTKLYVSDRIQRCMKKSSTPLHTKWTRMFTWTSIYFWPRWKRSRRTSSVVVVAVVTYLPCVPWLGTGEITAKWSMRTRRHHLMTHYNDKHFLALLPVHWNLFKKFL